MKPGMDIEHVKLPPGWTFEVRQTEKDTSFLLYGPAGEGLSLSCDTPGVRAKILEILAAAAEDNK